MASTLIESTFKTTEEGVNVLADIHLPPNATSADPRPILVWWHGGGLLQGTRKGIAPHLASAPVDHNLVVVSPDYRLAPQVRFPAILQDVSDLLCWLDSPAFHNVTGGCADPKRVVVSGSSAGGWLALLAGSGLGFEACQVEVPPRPIGVVALYPITDLLDPFWTTKQHPVSYFPRVIDGPKELGQHLDPRSVVLTSSALDDPRSLFYHYMIQEAILAALLLDGTGIPPDAFSVAPAIADRRITLPPTFITHGSIDDKVVPKQSLDVYEAAKTCGFADIELHIEDGKDHLFDRDPSADMSKMYAFIHRYAS